MLETLLTFIIYFIRILFELFTWCLFIWVLMSWFAAGKSPLGQWLDNLIRPIIKPFSWARIGMLNLGPIVALFVFSFLAQNLIYALTKLLAML